MPELTRHGYSPVGSEHEEWAHDIYLVAKLIHYGRGTPEGMVPAMTGHIYLNLDGGTGTTLYVKESGAGDTGWAAK